MNGGAFLFLSGLFTLALLLIQRTEAKRRRTVIYLIAFLGLLIAYWANARALGSEFVVSLLAALLLNFLFWLLIGRYNPVGDSDKNIQVIGMDD